MMRYVTHFLTSRIKQARTVQLIQVEIITQFQDLLYLADQIKALHIWKWHIPENIH